MQEDYEDINMGGEFMFEFRYTGLLTVLSVAFLYSGGLPVMYPTAAMFFFMTYWTDKCLLFKCYRRPVKFDNYLARKTLTYFKWILLLHIVGFLLMYGLTPILQNSFFNQLDERVIKIDLTEPNLFPIYFVLIAFVLFEPMGIHGRWLKVRTYFQVFPFYRRGLFKRQKTFQKSDRLR